MNQNLFRYENEKIKARALSRSTKLKLELFEDKRSQMCSDMDTINDLQKDMVMR